MSESQHDEKRKFIRMRIESIVHFTVIGGSGSVYYGTSHNLSTTGLYMTTEQPLELGTEIEIIMNPEGKMLPPFVAQGKVIRSVTDEDDHTLNHISIEFTETN